MAVFQQQHAIRVQSLRAIVGSASVPQVFIDGKHIGGAESLEIWLSERKAA
jgi:glutaredoxin